MKGLLRAVLYLLIYAMVLLAVSGCSQDKIQPVAKNGVIDLSDWNFAENGAVNLTGEWEFYWHALYTPQDFLGNKSEQKTTYIHLPGLWGKSRSDKQHISAQGYATYRLLVKIPPDQTSKALLIRSILSVCKVWVNGELVSASGLPGIDKQSEQPSQALLLSDFKVVGDQVEIIIQNSNFHNVQGGLNTPIRFGNEAQVRHSIQVKWSITGVLGGVFLIIGFYHLLLHSLRRSNSENLYFGLYCIIWSIGSVFGDGGGSLARVLVNDLPWSLAIDLTLLSYGLTPPLIIIFYHRLFPRYKSNAVEWFYIILGVVFVVYLMATPPNAYGPVVRIHFLLFLGVLPYLLAKYTIDIIKKEQGARLLIPGYLALTISFINDRMHDLQIINTTTLMPFGAAVFFLFHSLLISMRFTQAFKDVELLSHELEEKNRKLKASLQTLQENIQLKDQLQEQTQKKELANVEAEKSLLEKLRYQLNPHFLFNALTSIRGAILKDGEIARDMIASLSEFCRLILSGGKEEWLKISQELQLVLHYLNIEQIRLGDYLTVNTEIEPEVEERQVPSFLLQPLVENAVKFGKLTSPEQLEIKIRISKQADRTIIEVANTGTWVEDSSMLGLKSTGIGLENLKKRIERIYPNNSSFSEKSENG